MTLVDDINPLDAPTLAEQLDGRQPVARVTCPRCRSAYYLADRRRDDNLCRECVRRACAVVEHVGSRRT